MISCFLFFLILSSVQTLQLQICDNGKLFKMTVLSPNPESGMSFPWLHQAGSEAERHPG
jgi:hypothetical protein